MQMNCQLTWLAYFLCLVGLISIGCFRTEAQTPAPPIEWGKWTPVGEPCGGTQIFVAVTKDDGRNDFEMKTKMVNTNGYAVQTRFEVTIESEKGEKSIKKLGGQLNANKEIDSCPNYPSFCFGRVFPGSVGQSVPTFITKFTVNQLDVANMSAPLGKKPSSSYLDPFRDYKVTPCSNMSVEFEAVAPSSLTWEFNATALYAFTSYKEYTKIENGFLSTQVKALLDGQPATEERSVSLSDLSIDIDSRNIERDDSGNFRLKLYTVILPEPGGYSRQKPAVRVRGNEPLNGGYERLDGGITIHFRSENEANQAAEKIRRMIAARSKN